MWLDSQELDDFEDTEFTMDELKGSLIHRPESTKLKCPHCGKTLAAFQYRLNSLQLEYCEDSHGFWLDSGEAERIMRLMDQREKDMNRKAEAETEWAQMLQKLRKRRNDPRPCAESYQRVKCPEDLEQPIVTRWKRKRISMSPKSIVRNICAQMAVI